LGEEDRIEMGLEDNENGMWLSMPIAVTCKYCDQTYKTTHINEEDTE